MEFHKRELGVRQPTLFSRQTSSEALVKRLGFYKQLKHNVDVANSDFNTVEFNTAGDRILSGCFNGSIQFWEWEANTLKAEYETGSSFRIFDVKIMPLTDDSTVVTCGGGEVRCCQVLEGGNMHTKRIGEHSVGVSKLSVEPGNKNVIYSCGRDGFVIQYDLRETNHRKLFRCSTLASCRPGLGYGGYGRSNVFNSLNTIVVHPRNPFHFSVGGQYRFARLFDIRKIQKNITDDRDMCIGTYCPPTMLDSSGAASIATLAYSKIGELLVSYTSSQLYLFQENMLLGTEPLSTDPLFVAPEDLQKLGTPRVYTGHRSARRAQEANFLGPEDEYVMSASLCGHIFLWRKKGAKTEPELVHKILGDMHMVCVVEPHPNDLVIASLGLDKNLMLWAPI